MENSLQAFYYMFTAFINFMLTIEVFEGVTVGGVLFAVILLGAVFGAIGLFVPVADLFGYDRKGTIK